MSTTTIKDIVNASLHPIYIYNAENPNDTGGISTRLGPGETFQHDLWIPWCQQEADFTKHCIIIDPKQASTAPTSANFAIWQANDIDGNHVRVSTDGFFHYSGAWASGDNAVGGNRKITFQDNTPLLFQAV